jgi:CheY-like chemotaxis protein
MTHAAPLAGIRVLVVDDEPHVRAFLRETMTLFGGTVTVAASAREALSALSDIDVVVTDFIMPGRDGRWLLARVLEQARRIPVIAITGVTPQERERLARAAFFQVLSKPVNPIRLCAVIQEAVEQPQDPQTSSR